MRALVVKSLGRVDLIGEHTDYALGYVMPAAVNLYIILVGRSSNAVRLQSSVLGEVTEFNLSNLVKSGDWSDYVERHFTMC